MESINRIHEVDNIKRFEKQYNKKARYETDKLERPDLKFIPKKHKPNIQDKIEYCEKIFRKIMSPFLNLYLLVLFSFLLK